MINVFGSSLAALVAVYELSKFEDVRWFRNSGNIGGHFSGLILGEMPIDLGMVINEPYTHPKRFKNRHQSLPSKSERVSYVHLVFDWLNSIGLRFQPISVYTYFRQKLYPDFLIADNLEILVSLSRDEQNRIIDELKEIRNSIGDFHPSNKYSSNFYRDVSYSEALKITSSSILSDLLILPWINKMQNSIGNKTPAIEHRAIWAPLYYPETLLGVLNADIKPSLLERPFAVPIDLSINQLLVRLKKEIAERQRVTFMNSKNFSLLMSREPLSKTYFYGNSLEFSQLVDKPIVTRNIERREIILIVGVLQSNANLNMVVNLIDSEILPYRLTLRSIEASSEKVQTFALEFGENAHKLDEQTLIIELENALNRLKIKSSIRIKKIVRTTVPIISREFTRDSMNEISSQNNELLNRGWLGTIVDFGTQSFNDQCLVGLWDLDGR